LVQTVRGFYGWDMKEAREYCEKFNYDNKTIEAAIANRFEDDRPQHGDDVWCTYSSKKHRKKKEDKASRGRGGGRGTGRSGERGRRGRGRGRGGRRGRGRGGRSGRGAATAKGQGNKENNPKQEQTSANGANVATSKTNAKKDWPSTQASPSTNSVLANPNFKNPHFNPNWGKPKTAPAPAPAPAPEPTITEPEQTEPEPWQEPTKTEDKTSFEEKTKDASAGDWDAGATPAPTETADQPLAFNSAVTQPGPWGGDKSSGKAWGTWAASASTSATQPQESSVAETASNWDASKPAGTDSLPQRQPRTSRQKKKVPEISTGINRITGRGYNSTSKWRKKESRPSEQKVGMELTPSASAMTESTDGIIEATQNKIANLSVEDTAEPTADDPNVILPSYVTNVKSDSMVFGLKDEGNQPHSQFLQSNGEIFGLKPADSMQAQMSKFTASQQMPTEVQLNEALQNGAPQNTLPTSSPTPQQQIQQASPPQNTSVKSQENAPENEIQRVSQIPQTSEELAADDMSPSMQSPEESSEQPGPMSMNPQSIPSQIGKPGNRSIGDHSMGMYQQYPPNMHPYMPSGDSRSFYDQTQTTQMHHPAFYTDYAQLQQHQQQQQARYQRGPMETRGPNSRSGRMYGKQNNRAKGGPESMKDAKRVQPSLQQADGPKNGKGKQKHPQRGNYKNQGMKQNFAKNNFSSKQRQGMPQQPPFNQQTYAMGAPVQFPASAHMPYPAYPNYHYYNYPQSAPQFSQPGYRGNPHYYQPAPNGYNYPANFHNPQGPNYDEQYAGDGKTGYQAQPIRGQPPSQGGPMMHQQQQQAQPQHNQSQQYMTDSTTQGGFMQHDSKQPSGPQGSERPQQDGPSTHGFDRASWTTSAPSQQQTSKLGESGPTKPTGAHMGGPSPNYRSPGFAYMPQSGFPDQHVSQQHYQNWNSTGNA